MKLLCALRIHAWRYLGPNGFGTGCFEQCRRCNRRRLFMFAGAYFYEPKR